MLLSPFPMPTQHERRGRGSARSLVGRSETSQCLAWQVKRALRATGYPVLCTINVSHLWSVVVLQGRVPTEYLRQMAHAIALAVPGVWELCNDVEVISRPNRSASHLARC